MLHHKWNQIVWVPRLPELITANVCIILVSRAGNGKSLQDITGALAAVHHSLARE